MKSAELSLIYITCSNKDEAKKIAKELVSLKLVACANIIMGMESIYEYDGEIHNDNEVILLLKTKSALFENVKDKVLDLHSYDLPCIVEIPVKNCHKEFANWITSSISPSSTSA